MEDPILQAQRKNKKARVHVHIPTEITQEILGRLPLKSLARFKCVSSLWSSLIQPIISRRLRDETGRSLWSSLIQPIISRRLRDETGRRMRKFVEARRSIEAICDESDEWDSMEVDHLRACGARMRAEVDEILSVVCAEDDFARCLGTASQLRDGAAVFVRGAEGFYASVEAAVAMREAGDA
ncbi:uncharacterized protein A4U43_C03F10 [Asparagus officinalis]|uniref:F-box domain-containing protein n=1 Tax=Asparagus officinalis TaxID=4686 RepID=A0A5P1FAM0_ASPOF|nr:uncharacterized protein A4U43_C03F10 [Asparagus officinalis]